MTPSNDNETQARIYLDDNECRGVVERITSPEASGNAIESLAEMLILLKEELDRGEAVPQAVLFELGRLIEFTFQHSDAYQLALELYQGRFHCIGGGDLEGDLRRLKAQQLAPSRDKGQASETDAREAPPAAPPAATDASDQARVLIISQLLKADEATLNHLLHLLDAGSRPMPERGRFSPEHQKRFDIFEAVALEEHQDPLRLDVLHRLLSAEVSLLQRVAGVLDEPPAGQRGADAHRMLLVHRTEEKTDWIEIDLPAGAGAEPFSIQCSDAEGNFRLSITLNPISTGTFVQIEQWDEDGLEGQEHWLVIAHQPQKEGEALSGDPQDSQPQPAVVPNRNEVVERMAELFEKYKNESAVSVHLSNILHWREVTGGGQEFERQLVAGAAAEILQSPETPEVLREVVARCIGELHAQVELFDLTEPEHVREFFSDVIAGLAKQSQPEQTGAELPPTRISTALRDALEADAQRCLRDLDAQALAILEYHYGLYKPVPGTHTDVDTVPTNEPGKESRQDEAQG